jgi:hypothetical protein
VGRNITSQETPTSGESWTVDATMGLLGFGMEATTYMSSVGDDVKKLFSRYRVRAGS